jgi:hypothetical protein
MSAWSMEIFANQQALDWLDDLGDEDDIYFIHNTLEIVCNYAGNEKPDSWDCCCALAAAEVVAAARGNAPARFPDAARRWLVDSEGILLADGAIQRVLKSSALFDELEANGQTAQFLTAMAALRVRLGI